MQQILIRRYILPLLVTILYALSTSAQMTADKAFAEFQTIEEQNRFVDNFMSIGSGEKNAYNLPIGIKKIVGNIQITLAITNLRFNRQYGELTLLMKMKIPQQSKELIFGASGVKISNDGDLIGDVQLSLLSDVSISMGSMGEIILRGEMNESTGTSNSQTYVTLECNGDFKELSINADVVLNKNTFVSVSDKGKPVQASFKINILDWNDLIAEVSFPTFEISGVEGFQFTLSNAVLDLSDLKNPSTLNTGSEYFNTYFTLPEKTLWRGLYVDKIEVTFPDWFKNKNASGPLRIGASGLIIDENGITGDIIGSNILTIDNGDAGGWAFSISTFQISFLANNISKFGFGGEIDIPISGNRQLRPYEAYIAKNEYLFKASLGDNLDFELFGNTKLQLNPTSYLLLELKNRQFNPKVVLNGFMKIDVEGLKMEQITFTKLTISPNTFSVESMGYGGDVKFNNFPITISEIKFEATNNIASLAFNLKLNLMKDNISADSKISLRSDYQEGKWRFKGLSINKIKLENIQMAGFSLDGEIRIEKDNPIYGDYFGGQINATFGALSDQLRVGVTAVFGSTSFRYWYVDGQVSLPTGIPIGPVLLTGFTGGAYYRMSATGKSGLDAYAPNEECSLGLKAGVFYSVGSNVAINGEAVFEICFLSAGGIKNINFYGTANFMSTPLTDKLQDLTNMYKGAQMKLRNASGSLADVLPAGLSGSDASKELLPNAKLSGVVCAYIMMDYDFQTKTFDAEFRVMVNVPGGFLRGTGANNEVGWAKLYCSPQTWFIHVGTPSNPCGIQLGLGDLSLKTTSYFMLGDKLEVPPPPPNEILKLLNMTSLEADYMKYPTDMKLGKGIAFGSRFEFDTGDLSFLILYARFAAGIGLDVMLCDMSHYACEGSRTPVGINGWYANGQSYAYLSGEMGVRVKLLGINKRMVILKGSTATLLQARLPNPTWVGGSMAVNLNVLGIIKANMKMKFSFGDDCKLVSLDGDYSPLDFPIIADLTPLDRSTDVNVFLSPQATFNIPVGKTFSIEDEDGRAKSYRIKLEDFYITDSRNQKTSGTIKWNNDYSSVTFRSEEILTPNTDMKVTVSVLFEELKGNTWSLVSNARETKSSSFKTGDAPNYIPLSNIVYCYPVVSQKNLYRDESTAGYVQLEIGQSYLFPENFNYNAIFTSKSGQQVTSTFRYNSSNKRIDFSFPSLNKTTDYGLSFVASTNANSQSSAEIIKTTNTMMDGEGEMFSLDYLQQAAQQIIKDGSMKVLDYSLRTSEYNTLEQKLTTLKFNSTFRKVNSDIISLLLQVNSNYELFDVVELEGSQYTGGKPLITAEAILDDAYFNNDIKPLVYGWYPVSGITITDRNVNIYGVPPTKAFPLYNGYINFLHVNRYDNIMSRMFPFVYELPYYYYLDYHELRNKAANALLKGLKNESLKALVESQFLFIREGYYKSRFMYNLPGGNAGTSKNVEYYNKLDWR